MSTSQLDWINNQQQEIQEKINKMWNNDKNFNCEIYQRKISGKKLDPFQKMQDDRTCMGCAGIGCPLHTKIIC